MRVTSRPRRQANLLIPLNLVSDQALRRNGIGDGSYAFDLQLDADIANKTDLLELRAVSKSGETSVLRVPSSDERAAEAAVAVPLSRVLERLDMVLAIQRQVLIGQRDTMAASKTLTERVGSLSAEGGAIDTAVTQIARSQADLEQRVGSIEVFLTRFDTTLAGFDKRVTALHAVGKHEIKPLVIILSTILGFVSGVVMMVIVH